MAFKYSRGDADTSNSGGNDGWPEPKRGRAPALTRGDEDPGNSGGGSGGLDLKRGRAQAHFRANADFSGSGGGSVRLRFLLRQGPSPLYG